MRAFVIDGYKGALHEAEVPEPVVGEHDVLVRAVAAGVNQLDEKIRTGEFRQILPYRFPLHLGHDVAGTVIRVGSKVDAFAPGDVVYARPRDRTDRHLRRAPSRSTRPTSHSHRRRSAPWKRHPCRWSR